GGGPGRRRRAGAVGARAIPARRVRPHPPDVQGARQGSRPGPRAARAPALRAGGPRLRVTRIVFATQVVDPDDPILGAVVGKLRALAERVDEVAVLALRAVPGVLPGN